MIVGETNKPMSEFRGPDYYIVNPINLSGAMGAGIAKLFREAYPSMYSTYTTLCKEHMLVQGSLFFWTTSFSSVLNFPTKVHYKNDGSLALIKAGLQTLDGMDTIETFVTPRLGCGLGGLDWQSQVRPLLDNSSVSFIIASGLMLPSDFIQEDERSAECRLVQPKMGRSSTS